MSEAIKIGGGGWGGYVGGQVAGVSGGGRQIGAKSWIFQTELGPIPVTRCDQCYAFSPPDIALSNNRHNAFSRVKNTTPSEPRPRKFFWGAK